MCFYQTFKMSVRYPAFGKTKRSAWGLTVKKGPWKETLKDKTYQVSSQKHAGHGDWYSTERPNINNTQGGDPMRQQPPRVVTSKVMYSASEFIPKTRPGRLQRSYLTERQQKQVLTSQPAGLGPPMAEAAQGFQRGSGPFAPPTPPPTNGGINPRNDRPPRMFTGAFHSEGQNIYPSPVSEMNPNGFDTDADPDHDPIDDLAPPNNVVQSPWQPALEHVLENEEHGLVVTEDHVMHAADAAGDEAEELAMMSEYIISQHPGNGDLIDEYLKKLLETDGIEGIREEYEILKGQGGGPPEAPEGQNPTLPGGGVAPSEEDGGEEEGDDDYVGILIKLIDVAPLSDDPRSAMIDQLPSVPETLPTSNLDRIEVLLKTKNPWENDDDIRHLLEIAQASGDQYQTQLLRHLINQPNLVGLNEQQQPLPSGGELDVVEKLRQVIYQKFPDASKHEVEKGLLRMVANGQDPQLLLDRYRLGDPPSPFEYFDFPLTGGGGGYRDSGGESSNDTTPSSSGRPSAVSGVSMTDEEYYNDPLYDSLTNALSDSMKKPPPIQDSVVSNRRPPKRPHRDEDEGPPRKRPNTNTLEGPIKRPHADDEEGPPRKRPNIKTIRVQKPPPINTKPTSSRFPPVNYKELSSGASTPTPSPDSSDERREKKNAKRREKYARDKAAGKLPKRKK